MVASSGAALIGVAVAGGWAMPVDLILFRGIAGPVATHPSLAAAARMATHLGDPDVRYGLTALAAGVLLVGRDLVGAGVLVLTSLSANIANSELKLLVARPRPSLLPRLDAVTTMSFPSGHAANSAALYLLLALLVMRRGGRRWPVAAAGLLVLAIGLTRVALAVHWPSDVAAGWCLGAAWALAGLALAQTLDARRRNGPRSPIAG